jgi:(2Fe-2S) ferredoxin
LATLVDRLQCAGAAQTVVGAFVDQATPSLPQALDLCAQSGAERILVVPVYLPDDRNLGSWLVKVIGRWKRQRMSSDVTDVQVSMSPSLGDHEGIANTVIQLVSDAQGGDPIAPISPRRGDSEIGEPEWSIIPPHKFHLMQCRGPRCTARGSGDVWKHLNGRLMKEGMLDKDVLVAQTGCLFPCNLGPMMVVYPEGVWYCGLNEAATDRIVEEHFRNGQVVSEYARKPASHAQRMPGQPT